MPDCEGLFTALALKNAGDDDGAGVPDLALDTEPARPLAFVVDFCFCGAGLEEEGEGDVGVGLDLKLDPEPTNILNTDEDLPGTGLGAARLSAEGGGSLEKDFVEMATPLLALLDDFIDLTLMISSTSSSSTADSDSSATTAGIGGGVADDDEGEPTSCDVTL